MKICSACQGRFSSSDWICPLCGWRPPILASFPAFAPELAYSPNDFAPEGHDLLVRLEQKCFWFRGRNRMLQTALERYFPTADSFLELGCGTGFVLAGLARVRPQMRLVGGDCHPSGLRWACQRVPQAEFIQVDASHLPYVEEFQVVGVFDVLEHLDNDQAVLEECHKVLRAGGGMIVTVPQHPWLWSPCDDLALHKRRYRRQELAAKIRQAGFKVLFLTSFITVLFPLLLASRWWCRGHPGDLHLAPGFGVPPWVDAVLEHLLKLELHGLRLGLSLPFGGSLLCVAQKG